MRFAGKIAGLWLLVSAAWPVPGQSREPADDGQAVAAERAGSAGAGMTMKTLGGRQFWGDVQFFHRWRIQQNVFTKHYRLLDEHDHRHASGTLEECRQKLADIRRERKLPPMSGKGVILIHGIVRSSKSFARMSDRLAAEGYEVFRFDYPSTQVDIPTCAEYLDRVVTSLDGIEQIDLVVHSMGGLVVRSYAADHHDPRIRRLVMLGVPNRGAAMADLLRQNILFRAVFGPAGQQLVSEQQGLVTRLPTPRCEFGIIAGARGTEDGWNPLIPGDDDATVEVTSTQLPGASDFITVPVLHSFLTHDRRVIEPTVRYLATGAFREDGTTQPIPLDALQPTGDETTAGGDSDAVEIP